VNPGLLGDPENPIWIVSNFPKKADKMGPMSSITGKGFTNYMLECGLPMSGVHFEYLTHRTPNKGGLEYFEDSFVHEEVEKLRAKIEKYKPNIVFCLGADPLKHLLKRSSIAKWRGHVIWDEGLQTKFMCTFEPFHAHRQSKVPKKQKPGQYTALMRCDIQKAVDESKIRGTHFHEPKYILQPTYAEVMQELDRMEKTAKEISFDIEIVAPYDGHLMDCIGLSMDLDSAICIPFWIPNGDNQVIPYWNNELEFTAVFKRVAALLESPIPKVAQNGAFDIIQLEVYYGIKVCNFTFDTMVMGHELYCDFPKDLGTLIGLYTNLPYHKHMIKSESVMDRWEYNAADAVANLHVKEGQLDEICDIEEIERKNVQHSQYWKHYYEVTNPSIQTCIAMQIRGVRIDVELRDYVIKTESSILDTLNEIMDYIFPIQFDQATTAQHKFNFNSPDQKKALFYDILGCETRYKDGKPTVNSETMEDLMRDSNLYVATMAELCYEYRASDARLGKFKVTPDNGYIRTAYDVAGTDTGRLASKASEILPGGTNLQNIQKGKPRQMLIPEEGEEFSLVDLFAAEAYLIALDSGELGMLEMLQSGQKIYQWLLEETEKLYPQDVARAKYNYKAAKQSVHGCNYGVKPWKMHIESGLPVRICEWQHSLYHGKYPGIAMRMKRVERQVNDEQYMISPLGRRRYFFIPAGHERNSMAYAWPSQSAIGEITKIAMNKLYIYSIRNEMGDPDLPFCMPNLNTHDGLAIRSKLGTREKVEQAVIDSFDVPMKLGTHTIRVPIEIGWGENFNDMVDEVVHYYPMEVEG
jgi:DNA polymerase I-like protein with 3'-5' exonuclease and polymerase domains